MIQELTGPAAQGNVSLKNVKGFSFTDEHNRSQEMSVCKHIKRLRFISRMHAGRCADERVICTCTATLTRRHPSKTNTHTHTDCIRKWPFIKSLFLSKQRKWRFHESHRHSNYFSLRNFCEKWQQRNAWKMGQSRTEKKKKEQQRKKRQERTSTQNFLRAVT